MSANRLIAPVAVPRTRIWRVDGNRALSHEVCEGQYADVGGGDVVSGGAGAGYPDARAAEQPHTDSKRAGVGSSGSRLPRSASKRRIESIVIASVQVIVKCLLPFVQQSTPRNFDKKVLY